MLATRSAGRAQGCAVPAGPPGAGEACPSPRGAATLQGPRMSPAVPREATKQHPHPQTPPTQSKQLRVARLGRGALTDQELTLAAPRAPSERLSGPGRAHGGAARASGRDRPQGRRHQHRGVPPAGGSAVLSLGLPAPRTEGPPSQPQKHRDVERGDAPGQLRARPASRGHSGPIPTRHSRGVPGHARDLQRQAHGWVVT